MGNEWKLEIRKADNGYILKGRFNSEEELECLVEENKPGSLCDNESNLACNDLSAMSEVLYMVKEYFGVYYSDHNYRNIEIEIKENDSE